LRALPEQTASQTSNVPRQAVFVYQRRSPQGKGSVFVSFVGRHLENNEMGKMQ